jgi:hypothetical protein
MGDRLNGGMFRRAGQKTRGENRLTPILRRSESLLN